MIRAILAYAALAVAAALLTITVVLQFEPQWVINVGVTENGQPLHCKYIGLHTWECS